MDVVHVVLRGAAAVRHQAPTLRRPVDVPDVLLPDHVVQAKLGCVGLDESRKGLPSGRIGVDHEVQGQAQPVILSVRASAVAADVPDAEHRAQHVRHRRGPRLHRPEHVRGAGGHERQDRLQVCLGVVVGEDCGAQPCRVRHVTTSGAKEKACGGGGVLDVLGVRYSVTVRVPSPDPPGTRKELHRANRVVPHGIPVEETPVRVGNGGEPGAGKRRADDRGNHPVGCRERAPGEGSGLHLSDRREQREGKVAGGRGGRHGVLVGRHEDNGHPQPLNGRGVGPHWQERRHLHRRAGRIVRVVLRDDLARTSRLAGARPHGSEGHRTGGGPAGAGRSGCCGCCDGRSYGDGGRHHSSKKGPQHRAGSGAGTAQPGEANDHATPVIGPCFRVRMNHCHRVQ